MRIYFMEDDAFIDCHNGKMLCIGTKEDVERDTEDELCERISYAVAYSKFKAIESGEGQKIH